MIVFQQTEQDTTITISEIHIGKLLITISEGVEQLDIELNREEITSLYDCFGRWFANSYIK